MLSVNVTNLDFVEYLLEVGADPNAKEVQDTDVDHAVCPGAAKFLLNWPTDANITTRSGASFLATVRWIITAYSDRIAFPYDLERSDTNF
jgi:hypothetical protein